MSKQLKLNDSGAASLVIIGVLVLALLGGAGYMVWKNKSDTDKKKQAETAQMEQAKAAANAQKAAEDKRIADAKAKLKLAAIPYMSQDLGGIPYPDGWKVTENPADSVVFSISNPTADKDQNGNEYSANVAVAIDTGIVDEVAYLSQIKSTNASIYQDYKITAEREVAAHDLIMKVVEATFTQGSLKLKQMQALYVEDAHAVLFSSTALARDWPIYQDIFEQVLTN